MRALGAEPVEGTAATSTRRRSRRSGSPTSAACELSAPSVPPRFRRWGLRPTPTSCFTDGRYDRHRLRSDRAPAPASARDRHARPARPARPKSSEWSLRQRQCRSSQSVGAGRVVHTNSALTFAGNAGGCGYRTQRRSRSFAARKPSGSSRSPTTRSAEAIWVLYGATHNCAEGAGA